MIEMEIFWAYAGYGLMAMLILFGLAAILWATKQ